MPAWLIAIFSFIQQLMAALPIIARWLTKTPTEKVKDGAEKIDDAEQALKKGERPKW